MSVHSLVIAREWQVIGMPSPELKKKFIYVVNNKFLGKCWYGRRPWIWLAMDCERRVEKGINFILCLGTAYDISSMESFGNYSVIFVDGKSMPLENFISCFELWHLFKSLLPSAKGLSIYFMQFLFLFESPSSLIKHQLGSTMIILVHWMQLIFKYVS